MDADLFYLYSIKHTGTGNVRWWGPNRSGYYEDLRLAGRYTAAEAKEIVGNGETTAAVLVWKAEQMTRHLVDRGWGDNARILDEAIATGRAAMASA